MKKLKSLFISLLMLLMIGSSSGCTLFGGAPDQEALEVIKTGFINLYGLTSFGYELNMSGDIAIEGQSADYELTMSGGLDMSDRKAPLFTLDFDGGGVDDKGDEFGIEMEMRLDKENFYFILSNSTAPEGQSLAGSLDSFLGIWWRVAIPEGTFGDLPLPVGDKEALTESDKEFRELLENTVFFKNFKYDGTKKGSYVYTADLDKEAISEFRAKREGQSVSESDIVELDKALEAVEMPFEIWVDKDSMILSKISSTLTIEEAGSTINLDFELIISDFDEPLTVEAPAESTEFDPTVLFGAIMGGMGDVGTYEEVDTAEEEEKVSR